MNIQRHIKMHKFLWLWWVGVITLGILLWLSAPCAADDPQGESTIVIYQVTYSDKSIVNLPNPPTTNKDILMVTRITRTNSSLPSTETVSTGNQSMEYLNPGRTQETQLQWDGQAWVAAVKIKAKSAPVAVAPAPSPVGTNPTGYGNDIPRRTMSHSSMNAAEIREKMQEIMELLSVSDRALRQAEQQVAMASETPSAAQEAERSLAQARKAHQDVMTNMIQLKSSLGLLQAQPTNLPVAQAVPQPQPQQQNPPYDPNQPITPPAVLNTSVAASGNFGYGWSCAGGWPYFGGNVAIQNQEPNPDFDTGPRVIIREQK